MNVSIPNKIIILIENRDLFRTLEEQGVFDLLREQGLDPQPLWADKLRYEPGNRAAFDDICLIVNRMSPSSPLRGHANGVFAVRDFLYAAARCGVEIINPATNYDIEISKSRQIQLLSNLSLQFPRTIVVNQASDLLSAAHDIGFPLVVKSGVSALGGMTTIFEKEVDLNDAISRFDQAITPKEYLDIRRNRNAIPPSIDRQWLVQEKKNPRNGKVYRVEILGRRILYVVEVMPRNFGACVGSASTEGRAFAIDLDLDVAKEVLSIAKDFHLDVGGVEFLIDEADGQRYYFDLNALSNYAFPNHLKKQFPNEPEKYNLRGYDPENGEWTENVDPFWEFAQYIVHRVRKTQQERWGGISISEEFGKTLQSKSSLGKRDNLRNH